MNFIIDENLPLRLVGWIAARGATAHHVATLGLRGVPDRDVWAAALASRAVVVSRDSDFIDIARREMTGCAVRLTIGNCSTATLLSWLDGRWPTIVKLIESGEHAIEV